MANPIDMAELVCECISEECDPNYFGDLVRNNVFTGWITKDLDTLTPEMVMDTPEFKEGMRAIVLMFINAAKASKGK